MSRTKVINISTKSRYKNWIILNQYTRVYNSICILFAEKAF